MSNQFQKPEEIRIKIITVGPAAVGKTSLLRRIAQDSFNEDPLTTVGLDFFIKMKLQLWDTAGQERFQTPISKLYYRATHGIFFVFDISNEQSFQEVNKVYESTMNDIKNIEQNICCVLVGCKSDLENKREISYDAAMAYAQSLGMHYIETSAKMNKNCLEAAQFLAKICLEKISNNKAKGDAIILIQPKNKKGVQQYPCC